MLLKQAGWDGYSWEGENAVLGCASCGSADNLRIKRIEGSGGVTDYLVSCFTPECTPYEAICALRHERGVRFPGDETVFRYSKDHRKFKLKQRYILSAPMGKRLAGDRAFAWTHWDGTTFVSAKVAKERGIWQEWTPLYNLDTATEAAPLSEVWLTEGESDVDAHRRNGVIAVSHPDGAKPISDEQARQIASLANRVVICGDKDTAGYIAMYQWYEALTVAGAVVDIRLPSGKAKDARRHYAHGYSPEQFVITTPQQLRAERDRLKAKRVQKRKATDAEPSSSETESAELLGYTDSEMADRFVAKHGHELRYAGDGDDWKHYRNGRWKTDSYEYAIYLSEKLARELLDEARDEMAAATTDEEKKAADRRLKAVGHRCSTAAVTAVVRLARTRKPIVTKESKFDRDPMLLNLPNGTYNLETRELQPHDPADMITRVTRGRYAPDARCDDFDTFLRRVQPKPEWRELLWQVLGSSLSGFPGDTAFLWTGEGANGKSTMLWLALNALGEYGGMAEPRILDRRAEEQHTTGQTDLIGKRVVGVIFPSAGRALSSDMLKTLVDEPTITARRMREDNKTLPATHTFQICVNGAPPLTANDEGSRRRIRSIPWNVTIPPGERNNRLRQHLAESSPDYVITQIIDGYYRWNPQEEPPELAESTETLYRAQNRGHAFFADCLERDEKASTPFPLIQLAASRWCEQLSERPFSDTALGKILADHGGKKGRGPIEESGKRARIWHGIAIKPESDE